MLGHFYSIQENDVRLALGDTTEGRRQRPPKGRGGRPTTCQGVVQGSL